MLGCFFDAAHEWYIDDDGNDNDQGTALSKRKDRKCRNLSMWKDLKTPRVDENKRQIVTIPQELGKSKRSFR